MGQCLSTTLKIVQAVNEAQQEAASSADQPSKPSSAHGTGAATGAARHASLPAGAEAATVRNVYDGDTLTLTDERRVRFLGVDTPEVKENQPFAQEAKAYTKNLCDRKTVYLSFDGEKEDHYGRLLAHVYVEAADGGYICVNEGIVAAGLASVYAPSSDKKTRNYDTLIALQAQARAKKLGIHSAAGGSGDSDRLVVKTTNGTAYHLRSCENLDPKWRLEELTVGAAQDKGLHPCRTCLS